MLERSKLSENFSGTGVIKISENFPYWLKWFKQWQKQFKAMIYEESGDGDTIALGINKWDLDYDHNIKLRNSYNFIDD